jgi:hypothetical protein
MGHLRLNVSPGYGIEHSIPVPYLLDHQAGEQAETRCE